MATNNAVNTSLFGQTGIGGFVGSISPIITTPRIAQINDLNGNANLTMNSVVGAVNNFALINSIAGQSIELAATGTDTNITIEYRAPGTGKHIFTSEQNSSPIAFKSGTGAQHLTNFIFANTAATRSVTWPDADGTVAFTSTAVTQLAKQTFTSSGTYTPTSGMKYCIIECWGSGGGGYGPANSGATGFIFGGGGGGGGYSRLLASAATIGASKSVTIAAGGAGGTAGGNTGSPGGASSVGTLCIANGGAGGAALAGGAGGAAGTGDITGTGPIGGPAVTSTINTNVAYLGQGASSSIGGGGNTRSTTGTGNAGTGFASGGASGLSVSAGGTAAGGAGAGGFVIVTEYI